MKQFRIGYAPDSGFALRDRLKAEFDEAALRAVRIVFVEGEEQPSRKPP